MEEIKTKVCRKCGEEKLLEELVKNKACPYGRDSYCKKCRREYLHSIKKSVKLSNKRYNEKHKDKIKVRRKDKYENNKDSVLKKQKEYNLRNKDKIKSRRKIHYKKDKEKILIKSSLYKNSIAKFDTYKDKLTLDEEPIEGVNGELLVKCYFCKNYFPPTNGWVANRITAINGKNNKENHLYCCDEHKKECPIFRARTTPRDQRDKNKIARCNHPINREMLMQLQIDEFGYNFCEVSGNKYPPSKLYLHHTGLVSLDPGDADNMAGQMIVCRKHHKHKGCF